MAKRIGILGGMSPESTIEYYRFLTKKSFPEITICSVDFDKIMKLQNLGNKKEYIQELIKGIKVLEKAGADFAIIASNTPHIVFEEVQKQVKIPLISIVKAAAERAKKDSLKEVLLLGTKFTMSSDYYKKDFERLGVHIITPKKLEQELINKIIYEELIHGIIKQESKMKLLKLIQNYKVGGVVLGCTELPLLIKPSDLNIKVINTLEVHATKALEFSLQ